MLQPAIKKNDRKANILIAIFSIVVFAVIVLLGKLKFNITTNFDVHVFALFNACINSVVAILLIAALWQVKQKNYATHRNLMYVAMVLSILFLISYIAHHLLAGDSKFGDVNHDAIVDEAEKAAAGSLRYIYFVILITHILLASLILPFILFTAYRGLTGEWEKHRKLAKYTWPLWLYVAVTGPIVYLMIKPYY
jgi:putative membrane protein